MKFNLHASTLSLLKVAKLNDAIGRHQMFKAANIDSVMAANSFGIYKSKYRKRLNNKLSSVTGYYITSPNALPAKPGGNQKWYSNMVSIISTTCENTRTRQPLKRDVPDTSLALHDLAPVMERRSKRNCLGRYQCTHPVSPDHQEVLEVEDATNVPPPNAPAFVMPTYWDSPEAKKLFGILNSDVEDLQEMILDRINRLQQCYHTSDGWKTTLDDLDSQNVCTRHDIFVLTMKCRYLSYALRLALDHMPTMTWMDCCEEALNKINEIDGNKYTKSARTIQRWHLEFRMCGECFPNPRVRRRGRAAMLPPMLDSNPDLKEYLVTYAKENLSNLTAELLYSYLQETAMPALLEQRRRETGNGEMTMEELLKENQLKTLTLRTIYNWMDRLGFKYETRKKCYYVDNHEKPENVSYRGKFIDRYLEYEKRMHRWIQIPNNEVLQLVEEGKLLEGEGHRYEDANGNDMVEFHVDDSDEFLDRVEGTRFGGHLSVRKAADEKPLVCFGQDESIFKQYSFSTKAWTGPDGEKPLIPKDDGAGIMISAMVSREFGYGMSLSPEELEKVNSERRRGRKYIDEQAANTINGKADKPNLTSSPFAIQFEYGINAQGYWDYNRMMLQFEDCVDVVSVLFPEFEFVFLFDHSSGHDRQRPDGLSITKISKFFGGGQPKMRPSKILDGDLGTFEAKNSSG